MGSMYALDARLYAGKLLGLTIHLDGNWYPPIPQSIKDAIMSAFKIYWNNEISLEELADKCEKDAGLRQNALYEKFWMFFNEEDGGPADEDSKNSEETDVLEEE